MKKEKEILIAYDLGLDLSMYSVPNKIIQFFLKNYNVKFKLTNTKDSPKIVKEAEVYWGNRIDIQIIKEMPFLKWIHFGSVGINRVNTLNEFKKEIIVTSSKGLVSNSMITHIISIIGIYSRYLDIFLNKPTKAFSRYDYDKYFDKLKNYNELKILIIGLGNIGKDLAYALYNLGAKVDCIKQNHEDLYFINKIYNFKNIEDKLHIYDYIISLLPEKKETYHILNFKFFKNFSKDSVFINLGRGSTVNESDLLECIDSGIFRAAILDVLENEPTEKNINIVKNPKILLTPHIASFSPTYWELEKNLFEHNLKCYINKDIEKMKNVCNIFNS